MSARIIEIKTPKEARKEFTAIGVDPAGIDLMVPKAVNRIIKLKEIRPVAANIIKQEMLSFGGEAATAYGSVNHSVDFTDLLIIGNLKQLRLLVAKLKLHQFGLPAIAEEIKLVLNNYDAPLKPLKIRDRIFDFGRRTYIVGILNVTPDSFSDGGKFIDAEAALAQAKKMLAEGADIIDVGGESTRPGAEPVAAEEEIKRIIPVIERLAVDRDAIISVDTTKAKVAQVALAHGAAMVNDISGLHADPAMAKVVADYKVPLCLMHLRGTPKEMQRNPVYQDLLGEILDYLRAGLEIATRAGILHEKIIIDPGIGFGKTVEHNLEILTRLEELKILGCPLLIGTSRKSVIGQILALPVEERLEGTAATVALAIARGANFIRVHDVKQMARVAKMTDAVLKFKEAGNG